MTSAKVAKVANVATGAKFFYFSMVDCMDPVFIALLCIATVNSISLLSLAVVEYCFDDE